MRVFLVISVLLFPVLAQAQLFPFYDNYKWEKNPVISSKSTGGLYYYNKYMLAIEYEFDEYRGQYYKYKTEHYRVKLNTDISIEEFNKVYISMEDVVNLKSLKARVIKPSGVVELKPKVEEFYSNEESEQYYYFPISGIELGDEIEIIYTLKMEPQSDGDQFFFQGEVPIYNFDFYFITPNDTYFSFLGHNGFPKPELVDTILQRHQWRSHLDSIPAFKQEYFSEYNNVTMKLDATLRGFNKASDNSYSPYEEFNASLNEVYNVSYSGKDLKSIKALSARLGLHPKNKVEDNVRKIENYIKMEIALNGDVPMSTPMNVLIETERAGSIGAILMFMALLNENDIRFEYGFISDRYETYFSPEIESMHFLQNYIFYFPDIDAYLAPLDFSTRLGFLDQDWVPNNAYMLTMKQYPTAETRGKVKPVKATEASQNIDSTIIRVVVKDNFEDLEISIERHLTGYEAGEYQTYYYLYNDAKKEEKHQEMLDVLNDYSRFKLTSITNAGPENAFIDPLIVKGIVTELNVPLIERAGNIYVFKLGYLFGEYVDVHEIEKKKTDFVFGKPFRSSTTIDITFPEGYRVSSPQEIPQSDDLCPHEGIVMNSKLDIADNRVHYVQGQAFLSNRYSIEEKQVMMDVFRFLNSLHKMNLVVEK